MKINVKTENLIKIIIFLVTLFLLINVLLLYFKNKEIVKRYKIVQTEKMELIKENDMLLEKISNKE